ncbi:hypothetical protein Aph01nite_57870 [Acrocarpospora phusangensis]|uniref:DUF742 domain-containing protein n=1 Tax=Acrocarpospora phusangensis TaxID=1070424 RepID=A0A919QJS6_9ACTN|nr:DUF742 domain-containing protein [Acrocarpospora phusangensis]GIH27477.1 hypothetical protein Aph01nite_57870 [Acrocarpospora phusangensis]
MSHYEEWVDDGPVVRSYALTRGRAATSAPLDLLSVVAATGALIPANADLGREHRRLLELIPRSRQVAEVASEADLPLGVVRVLLGDLLDHGLILVRPPAGGGYVPGADQSPAPPPSESILREVITGLRAL